MSARPRSRVLVLDDSELAIEVIRSALEGEGFEVDVATDLQAFEKHRSNQPYDVLVLDVQLPEAFGDDLGATLRGVYGIEVPIILLSTLPEAELAKRAVAANVWGYVSKSAGLPALVSCIRRATATGGDAKTGRDT